MSLQTRRLSYALGVEVIGIDIRKPLDGETFSRIHAAFLEHSILLFRGLPLTREQHIVFSRRFGELDIFAAPGIRKLDVEFPEILMVTNRADGKAPDTYRGDLWHSDLSHWLIPSMASVLRGVEIPDVGGDTMFTNMYLAYETLSHGMKKLIEGLHGVHIGNGTRIDDFSPASLAETTRHSPPVAQPLVRVHPETGRKTLYLAEKLKLLVGLTAEESAPLIRFLCNHATRPQFVYRHCWQKDDLIMWDNRCVMHNALGDYDRSQIRHMERTTVRGTPSGYLYDGPMNQ